MQSASQSTTVPLPIQRFRDDALWACQSLGTLLVALALICVGRPAPSHAQDAGASVDEVIDVKLASFRYHPDTLHIATGERVKLVFHNEGNFEHEFMAGRSANEERAGYETDLFEGVDVTKRAAGSGEPPNRQGTTITVAPDSSGSLVFQLPASKRGEWEMGCFLTDPASHYKAGMKGVILVE